MGRIERRQQRKPSKRIWSGFRSKRVRGKLVLTGIVAVLSCLLILNILIWTSDVSELENPAPQPTIIYDQNGDIASKISNSSIEGVSLDQIPKDVIHAVISIEDQRFYKHNGINYLAIIRAFFQNMISGEIVSGGSTITQQLTKNAFLTHERTYTRKVKEFILTKKIERTYSKDEIIEQYLNQIYFGEGAWGIQRAAQVYFGKDVNQLTLSESTMLTGLIKAPSALSPIKNLDKAIERRNIVLTLMKNEGYIDQSDVDKAKEQPIVLEGDKIGDKYKGKYPYYVDHIIDEAINKYHLTENEVLSGGLHIYTELNPVIQDTIEEIYQDETNFPASKPDQLIQSGSIFLNPKTGGISAIVGGRGDDTYGFNHATKLIRQPGSTMKPLAVYTPALEQGYDIDDMLADEPINIDGYQPQNADRQYRGQVTMYDALIHSYNIPPVWLLQKIGIENGVNTVERFGIPLEKEDHSLGLGLGGLHQGTSPLLMAQAFSAFPNNGLMMEAHSIIEIEDSEGELVGKWSEQSVQITEPVVAQKMTYMLRGVVEQGTATRAQIPGLEVAGKTGTTQLPFSNSDGSKDHWFIGYTTDIVGAIWLGYDQTDPEHYLTSSSGVTAATIFQKILSKSINELPNKEFDLSLIEKKIKEQDNKKEYKEKKEKEKERKEEKKEKEKERKEEKKEKKKEREEKKKGKEKEEKKKKEG
ncbi:transglycosylase domain-containing protein [Alkalihalobacillus deserti]|uniref:transglycosylase domain-containing protein n=1 Tax=Alkalihalobacillus deserti TaxID=2879466 RepID=UPI001D13EF0B|nr:PBP1A family penicillin-binding protein [Alkalihalobacillus deserti]